jgi:toxin ParE1/3/4
MQVRWPPDAAADLENIVEYIRKENPGAAQGVAQTIYERAGGLAIFPNRGRQGRVHGTRELAVPPLPFIIVYRVVERLAAVEIVNVIHGARRWPASD